VKDSKVLTWLDFNIIGKIHLTGGRKVLRQNISVIFGDLNALEKIEK